MGSSGTDPALTPGGTLIGTLLLNTQVIAGAKYTTANKSGVTDGNGQYEYVEGDTVKFSLGLTSLGSIKARSAPVSIEDLDYGLGAVDPQQLAP